MDFSSILPLIGGGAVGALITIFYNWRKNKKQTVQYELITNSIFNPDSEFKNSVCLNIYDEQGNTVHNFYNLFLLNLNIKNIGNQDFPKFDFGINIAGNNELIKVEYETQDRKHEVSFNKKVSYDNTSEELDITLDPFNRNENYTFRFFIATIHSNRDEEILAFKEEDFSITSKLPITFTKIEKKENQITWKEGFISQIPILIIMLIIFLFSIHNVNKIHDEGMKESERIHDEFIKESNEQTDKAIKQFQEYEKILNEKSDSIKNVYNKIIEEKRKK